MARCPGTSVSWPTRSATSSGRAAPGRRGRDGGPDRRAAVRGPGPARARPRARRTRRPRRPRPGAGRRRAGARRRSPARHAADHRPGIHAGRRAYRGTRRRGRSPPGNGRSPRWSPPGWPTGRSPRSWCSRNGPSRRTSATCSPSWGWPTGPRWPRGRPGRITYRICVATLRSGRGPAAEDRRHDIRLDPHHQPPDGRPSLDGMADGYLFDEVGRSRRTLVSLWPSAEAARRRAPRTRRPSSAPSSATRSTRCGTTCRRRAGRRPPGRGAARLRRPALAGRLDAAEPGFEQRIRPILSA